MHVKSQVGGYASCLCFRMGKYCYFEVTLELLGVEWKPWIEI